MTTYIINDHGDIASGLSATEAAEMLLTHDGYQYDIRRDRGSWRLYVSQYSRNSTLGGRPLVGATIWSDASRKAAAWKDIAQQVIASGLWERDELQCMTEEGYAAMLATLTAEEMLFQH